MLHCMGASDHTRDPSPGATRQTFRCAGGTLILIGNSSQIGRLATYPPHPPVRRACKFGTRCTKREACAPTSTRCTGYRGGPKSGHKMQPSRPHKMRGHGRKRLGLKACSPRIRAVAGERQETCTTSLRHVRCQHSMNSSTSTSTSIRSIIL